MKTLLKRCACCKEEKPPTEFQKNRGRKDGLHTYCRTCVREKNQKWVRENREKHAATCANWYVRNKEKANQSASNWHYKSSYGVTREEYVKMVEKQKKCPLCLRQLHSTPVRNSTRGVIDHCHLTGKIRGVLCSRCNTAIGLLGDSPEIANRAERYLRDAKSDD